MPYGIALTGKHLDTDAPCRTVPQNHLDANTCQVVRLTPPAARGSTKHAMPYG